MSELGWRADGIARARAAGGIELERYRRPGFTGGASVRRVPDESSHVSGPIFDPWWSDPEPDEMNARPAA